LVTEINLYFDGRLVLANNDFNVDEKEWNRTSILERSGSGSWRIYSYKGDWRWQWDYSNQGSQ